MIFIRAEVLWVSLVEVIGLQPLKEFFYYYKPQEIPRSKGFYNFMCHRAALRLIFDIPDSNRQWKARFFFMRGVNWESRLNEWDSAEPFYDHS